MQTIDILLNSETRSLASETIKNAFLIDSHSSAGSSHTLIVVVILLIIIQLQSTALVTARVIVSTVGAGSASYTRYVL